MAPIAAEIGSGISRRHSLATRPTAANGPLARAAWEATHCLSDLPRLIDTRVDIHADQLERDIGSHAGRHFVDSLLDWLGEPDDLPRNVFQRLFHFDDEGGLRRGAFPT